MVIPEPLIADFAADPLSQNDKVLQKASDHTWPLYSELDRFLNNLPPEVVETAYLDETFAGLYENTDRMARIWTAQRLLTNETARRRLTSLLESKKSSRPLPYSLASLSDVSVDDEQAVRLSDLDYDNSTLLHNGFRFMVCPTTRAFNSTYWLLQSFYQQRVHTAVTVRLDPFLCGPTDFFLQPFYRMLVYARPLDWDGIANLRETHHGEMRPDGASDRTEVTQFCWTPREDGVHFVCEELPRKEFVKFEGARYLHAIYNPGMGKITHLDGALRIYSENEIEARLRSHVRNSGKSGVRRKIFRIDLPIDREHFSVIAQAFFIWNMDLQKYFCDTLSRSST